MVAAAGRRGVGGGVGNSTPASTVAVAAGVALAGSTVAVAVAIGGGGVASDVAGVTLGVSDWPRVTAAGTKSADEKASNSLCFIPL